jgi:hypothetical protein
MFTERWAVFLMVANEAGLFPARNYALAFNVGMLRLYNLGLGYVY